MVMLGAIVVMFVLATVDIGISWNIMFQHTSSLYMGASIKLLDRMYPKFLLYIVNKSVWFKICNWILTHLLTMDKFYC